jgi:hypothetical protein
MPGKSILIVVFTFLLTFSNLWQPQVTQASQTGIAHPVEVVESSELAQTDFPPTWNVLADNFESGILDKWKLSSPDHPVLASGKGYQGSIGLSVDVSLSSSYVFQTDVAKAGEGYLSFWFNPNGVSIPDQGTSWIPGKSLSIAEVVNKTDWWPPLVQLYVRRPEGQGYQAYLAWPIDTLDQRYFDYANAFTLVDDWQQITIGYHVNQWVAVWCNGELKRYATNVVHTDPYGDIINLGKTRTSDNNPSGNILFDEVSYQVPRLDNLWVDANTGDDNNNGLTSGTAFRTIQRAGDLAGPDTTVHILPGIYRETVGTTLNGSIAEPERYVAENGPGTVIIRGSEASASMVWTQLTTNTIDLPPGVDPTEIYSTDLSAWNLDRPPRFVVELDGGGQVASRLPLAREPDWNVVTEWKFPEFWWAADGGSGPAYCDPATDPDPDCDLAWRSTTQLTDRTDDSNPPGVEAGNLTTLGNLVGATLVAIDAVEGHYVYRRTITAHDVTAGRITVDKPCEYDSGSANPGLGWGTKYYVEGKPNLLDTPGEWWYDTSTGRLYLWPRTPGNPASKNIEISRRENGFSLRNRSYITLDGLTIEFFNGSAVDQINGKTDKSYNNKLSNLTLRYANWGVNIEQNMADNAPPGNVIDGFTVEGSEIAYMDTLGIRLIDWWEPSANPDLFIHSGITNTTIRNNELHDLGFRTDRDDAIGSLFRFANQLRFEGNHIYSVAHNGVQFSESVIQSPKEFGFDPNEIKTGDILVKGNIFEKTCQLTTVCGGLKIWGTAPDNHVFRNFLINGNVFRDNFGWSYVSEKRRLWTGGESSEVRGQGGYGLVVDHASGIHVYRNIAYNNGYAGYKFFGRWRDGEIIFVNNIAANSLYGIILGGGQYDTHGSVNTLVINNILVNNEGFGLSLSYAVSHYSNTSIDHNLYFNNGWRSESQGGIEGAGAMVIIEGNSYKPYPTLAEAQANTLWEDHGLEGDPLFSSYDPADHNPHDGSWPDFHLTAASANAMDRGTASLPASLNALLDVFRVDDYLLGSAYDIGRYEAGFLLLATPTIQFMDPNGTISYTLRLFPSDITYDVTLSTASPSPNLKLNLSPEILTGAQVAILTATDTHAGHVMRGELYNLSITGVGRGFSSTANLVLWVGGTRIYLPITRK